MARPIWNGSIAFGLVQIPVGLYGAEERDEISFKLLDKHDLAPVGYERVNKSTGKKVDYKNVVRGYEYEKGEYVVLSDEELAHANVESSQTIDIGLFVDRKEIDPMLVERPLYVMPGKQGQKAYRLLLDTLEKTGRAGIAQVVLRTRQHLAALVPHGDVLVLLMLRYAHELRSPSEIDHPSAKKSSVTAAERKMAEQLVEGMSGPFEPKQFQDTYYDDVMALVDRKVKSGKPTAITHPKMPKQKIAKVVDLADLLAKSLEHKKGPKKSAKSHANGSAHRHAPATGHSRGHAQHHKKSA